MLAFTLALSLLTAHRVRRDPAGCVVAPLPASLHESGRSNTASRGRYRARHLLMGGQVALALVLLVFVRSHGPQLPEASRRRSRLRRRRRRSPSASALPDREYAIARSAVAAHRAILDRLCALPGVTAASASTCLPLSGGCLGQWWCRKASIRRRHAAADGPCSTRSPAATSRRWASDLLRGRVHRPRGRRAWRTGRRREHRRSPMRSSRIRIHRPARRFRSSAARLIARRPAVADDRRCRLEYACRVARRSGRRSPNSTCRCPSPAVQTSPPRQCLDRASP